MGCNDEAYNTAIQKGMDYIASEEYQKAEGAFELALEEKKQNEKATALLHQTKNYQEALNALEEGELELALEKAEKVSQENEGSDALIKKADELVSFAESLQTTLNELSEKYDMAKEQYGANQFDDASKTIKKLLQQDMTHSFFDPIKNDIKSLEKDIEAAVVEREKAEKEAAERAAAEKAKEEQNNQPTVNLTGEEALEMIKNLGDWPLSTTFEFNPSIIQLEGNNYYNIYVNTHIDESNASRVNYLIDANNGKIFDYSRGELAALD